MLDEKSSYRYLTTLYLKHHLGVSVRKECFLELLAQPVEVVPSRMHEFIEGLQGVEVLVDDFLVVGFGHTHVEAVQDHDKSRVALYDTKPKGSS